MEEGFHLKGWQLFIYIFIFIFGTTGNSLVCLVVMRSPSAFRLVPFNIYLLSLAVVDFILAFICLPVYIMSTSSFSHPTGVGGTVLCKTITGYLLPFSLGGVSIYLLVIISFERYTAVRKPLHYRARQVSKKTCIYILGACIMGFLIQLPYVVGAVYLEKNATVGNHCGYTWTTPASITFVFVYTLIFLYIVPAVIFIINLYRIIVCLNILDRELQATFDDRLQLMKVMKRKRRTVKVMFVVSLFFYICWTPDNIMFLVFQYGGSKELSYNSDIFQLGMMLGFLNSCLNPFLYAFQSKEFRSHTKRVVQKLFRTFRNKYIVN